MRILLDLDEVVVDLLGPWLDTYNQLFDDTLSVEDLTTWDIRDHVVQEARDEILELLRAPGFFDALQPRRGAIAGVERLMALGHEVVVASAPSGADSARAKIEWVTRWLGHTGLSERDVVLLQDKSLLRADIIIDDRPEYLESFTGLTVCWGRPWNQGMREHVDLFLDGDDPGSWAALCDWIENLSWDDVQ